MLQEGEKGGGRIHKVCSLPWSNQSAKMPNPFKKTAEKVGIAPSCNLGMTLIRGKGRGATIKISIKWLLQMVHYRRRKNKGNYYTVHIYFGGMDFSGGFGSVQLVSHCRNERVLKRLFRPTAYAPPGKTTFKPCRRAASCLWFPACYCCSLKQHTQRWKM